MALSIRNVATAVIGCYLMAFCYFSSAGQAVPVTVIPASELLFYPERSAPAKTLSINSSNLSSEISSVVSKISVDVGDHVKKGDQLMSLSCDSYKNDVELTEAKLEEVRASYELTKFNLDQVEKIKKKGLTSLNRYKQSLATNEQSKARVKQLEVSLKSANDLVAKCSVKAPFDAVIIKRIVGVGEYVNPGTPLLQIVDTSHLEVSGQIQEKDLADLYQVKDIAFVSAINNYKVRLRSVVPVINPQLRSLEARFEFIGKTASPGEPGRIEWRTNRTHIPPKVLVRRGGSLGIYIVEKGRCHFMALPNAREGYPAAVNLTGKEQVVLDGRFNLKEGDQVEIVER